MRAVSIIGSGGHFHSLINLLEQKKYLIKGIFDDSYDPSKKEFINGYELKGKVIDYDKNSNIVLAVGNNQKRKNLFNRFMKEILNDNLIHKHAILENNVTLGLGNQIFAKVYINSNVVIENNNIINTGAVIEHETKIGSHNHISVNATLCGRVKIGNNCFVGAGAVVIDKISICDDVVIGSNSVVIRDIEKPGTYAGHPVRMIK